MVVRQLELRFGELPPWARERIEGADQGRLDRVAEQLLTASTLDEALA
jgi:hypothetical protein